MIKFDPFEIFDRRWALVTAGTKDHWNTMTISWGMMGTMWSRPCVTVYVRDSRYTLEFLENCDTFTLSFFDEKYKKDLGILGSVSGRDHDKVAMTSLTPVVLDEGIGFEQAKMTIVCKKLYEQRMDLDAMPAEIVDHYYGDKDVHHMFIGQVLEIEAQ